MARSKKKNAAAKTPIVHEAVYARLRRAIIEGQLEPGRALSVRTLAAQFAVSAMPAREAIRRLVALGALEMTETRRIMIARLTPERVDELKEARTLLEPRLAMRAFDQTEGRKGARRALIKRLSGIDTKLDVAIERGDVAAYSKTNSEFHFALYEAASAPILLGVVESLWLQTGPFMRVVVSNSGTSTLVDRHKEAVEALADDDRARLGKSIELDITEGMDRIGEAVAAKNS